MFVVSKYFIFIGDTLTSNNIPFLGVISCNLLFIFDRPIKC